MKARGVRVLLCGVRRSSRADGEDRPRGAARRARLPRAAGAQTSTLLAIRYAYEILDGRCAHCPRRGGLGEQKLFYQI
jgi:hypothetical protein